nr:MAG TPA: hypothetical protein [Caudoviricetes sp.]
MKRLKLNIISNRKGEQKSRNTVRKCTAYFVFISVLQRYK